MTDHSKSDISELVMVKEGYRLAAMQKLGAVACPTTRKENE